MRSPATCPRPALLHGRKCAAAASLRDLGSGFLGDCKTRSVQGLEGVLRNEPGRFESIAVFDRTRAFECIQPMRVVHPSKNAAHNDHDMTTI